jgi:beta-N-acetylhexosaminidase
MSVVAQKVAQMIMTGIDGCDLTREQKSLFRAYPFGGYILFSHNCCEAGQILSLCRSLRETADTQPPFIAIDQEGGRIHRLPPPFIHFPAARLIGRRDDPHLAYRAGRATGAELALVGINLNFAPVLDIDSNPKNPIIGNRSFGSTAKRVIKIGTAWTQGLRDGGVIPCAKHFPGHGDTDRDSHLALPFVDRRLAELRSRELLPFAHAVRYQIESLMTAHVVFRFLDPDFPATLSSKIIGGFLRGELAYNGVVFGDDLEMRAVSDDYGEEEVIKLAVNAGLDILMFCHDRERAVRGFEFLCREAERDPRVRARVDESFERITKLKRRFSKTDGTAVSVREVARRLKSFDHQKIVAEIYGSL